MTVVAGSLTFPAEATPGLFTMREIALIATAAAKNADDAVPTSPVPQIQALAQRCLAVAADRSRQAKGN